MILLICGQKAHKTRTFLARLHDLRPVLNFCRRSDNTSNGLETKSQRRTWKPCHVWTGGKLTSQHPRNGRGKSIGGAKKQSVPPRGPRKQCSMVDAFLVLMFGRPETRGGSWTCRKNDLNKHFCFEPTRNRVFSPCASADFVL